MSDNDHQPEEMRPIPDGGLQEAMPSWLKRPPAWRSMPTAEQRHERALPEPDTSVIDPRTLVDVADLPQWLQSIAERGDVPIPDPDESVGHAVQQVQAVHSRPHVTTDTEETPEMTQEPSEDLAVESEGAEIEGTLPTETESAGSSTSIQDEISGVETTPADTSETSTSPESGSKLPLISAGIVFLLILVIALAYFVL